MKNIKIVFNAVISAIGSVIIAIAAIVTAIVVIIFIAYSMHLGSEIEYETWSDTKNVFGNGEYQQYDNNIGTLDLINMKYNCTIINSVANYAESNNNVYFRGYTYDQSSTDIKTVEVYAVLNLDSNVIQYNVKDSKFNNGIILYSDKMITDGKLVVIDDYNTFSDNDKAILNSL